MPPAPGQRRRCAIPAASAPGVRLTDRQLDVLRRIAVGQSNKEIARELELSLATVKAHAAANAALGAVNRTEAVMKARAIGLI
jgi:DNA-binding NarL/FixJ family response regulator